MSDTTIPREDPSRGSAADAPAATQVIAAEEVKALCATMKELAGDLKSQRINLDEATDRSARVLKAIEEAQKKSVPVAGHDPGPRGQLTLSAAINRRWNDKQFQELQEQHDRAICRSMIRCARSKIPMSMVDLGDNMRAVDVASLPREVLTQTPEYREMMELAAGSHIDTTTSTSGAEWVPTGFSRMAVDFYFIDSGFEAALTQQMVPDGVGAFSVPIETARAQARQEAQQTAVSSAYISTTGIHNPLTGVISFSPKKLAYGWQWSGEANEDLAVDTMARALRAAPAGIRRGVRQCIINGQTASDATLDDAPAVSDIYTADDWSNAAGDNSMRLHCVVNGYTTPIGGGLTFADTITGRKAMGKFGLRPQELGLVCGPVAAISLFGDEDHVTTLEKMGPQATVLTGQLASIGGIPLFPDSEFPDTLDAAGINAGTGTASGAVLFNRARWWLATKRNIETYVIPGLGMDNATVLSRWRGDTKVAITTEHSAHYFVNIS